MILGRRSPCPGTPFPGTTAGSSLSGEEPAVIFVPGMNGPCAVWLPLDCMTKRGSVSQAGRETGEPLFCPPWQLPSGRDPSSTGFSFCKDFPLYCRQETVAGILKKNRTGQELRIKNTFQNRVYLFIFCVKTHNWNCYIAQLFSDQSSIVQLGVVVWSENCDAQANSMNQRRKLCSVHNFRRCLWWL